jgi:hypothetical protein
MIQRRGFAPAERITKMERSNIATIPFKGKDVRIALTGECPMYNVADIHAIVGRGKLERAVKRAMKESWTEDDESGSEIKCFPKFEERGTPPQLFTNYEGVFFLSHKKIQNNDPEKTHWVAINYEFTEWFEGCLMENLCEIMMNRFWEMLLNIIAENPVMGMTMVKIISELAKRWEESECLGLEQNMCREKGVING